MSRYANANGKRQIVFDKGKGFSDMPITVPCGKCIGCRIDHSRQWAIRCVHESKLHQASCFLTLTYDPEHLPEGGTLVKEHVQKFLRKLRKEVGSCRYYGSGEYGDNFSRPHYHLIIFGLDFASDRKYHSRNSRGDTLFYSPTATRIWGKGHVTIGQFNYTTAAYTARYVMKKYRGKNPDEHYSVVNPSTGEISLLLPEFSLMSLKPGIGAGWYEKFKSDVFPHDNVIHQGKAHTTPRFYLNKLQNESPVMYKEIKAKRKKALIDVTHEYTPDRLAVREECKIAQTSTLKRSL